MRTNGTPVNGLRPSLVLGTSPSPFSAIYTLKQDDSDWHAAAVAALAGSRSFADKLSGTALVHTFSISRINQNQVLFQANFDGDLARFMAALAGLEEGLRALLPHFHGAPDSDAPFAEMLEFLAAGQVDVIACYSGYPDVTVNQIRWQFGLGPRVNRSIPAF